MAMYANIDGTNKLLAQTAAEMTAVGGLAEPKRNL